MKIACIATSQVPSSTANSIQVMKACQALAQVGNEVCLWVPGAHGAEWAALAEQYGLSTPFEVRWLPTRQVWRRYDLAWNAARAAKQWGAQVVYTWAPQAAVFAQWRGLPAVLELHDRITGKVGPLWFRWFLQSRQPRRLLLITEALRAVLERQFGMALPAPVTQIAPNGTEMERYENLPDAEEARRQLGLPQGLTAVFSGHFYAGRGTDLLFELARHLPELNFVWVGGREKDVAVLREKLAEANMENVVLSGFVPNAHLPLYQAAGDFLLMPYERSIAGSGGGDSAAICSPMKMFDYLAAGRVIVTSELPVLHEVLNDHNAVFCPPEDAAAWADALRGLMRDALRRESLSTRAREDARAYTWKARAERALAGLRQA